MFKNKFNKFILITILLVMFYTQNSFGQRNLKDSLIKVIEVDNIENVITLFNNNSFLKDELNQCSDIPALIYLKKNMLVGYKTKFARRTLFEIICDCNDTVALLGLINLDKNMPNQSIGNYGEKPLMTASKKVNMKLLNY